MRLTRVWKLLSTLFWVCVTLRLAFRLWSLATDGILLSLLVLEITIGHSSGALRLNSKSEF